MNKLMVMGAILASFASSVLADDVTLKKTGSFFASGGEGTWSDTLAPHPGSDYYVGSGKILQFGSDDNGKTFEGESLTIQTGGSLYATKTSTVTIDDFILDGGTFACNRDNSLATVAGQFTVTSNGGAVGGDNSAFSSYRRVRITANLVGPSDAFIRFFVALNGTACDETDKGPLDTPSYAVIEGDASQYLGSYVVGPFSTDPQKWKYNRVGGVLRLDSATALAGNGGVAQPGKITMEAPAQLYLSAKTAAGADALNGMTVTGAENWIGTIDPAEKVVLSMPISGTGALIKRGAGEVVFDGALAPEDGLTIAEGTATISANASVAQGMLLTVKAGASLALETDPSQFQLTVEDGGSVQFSVQYSPSEDDRTVPLVFDATTIGYVTAWPMGIRLTESIPLPFKDEKRLLVAKIPTAGKVVTAADFVNTTASSAYNLPNTWFEVVPDAIDTSVQDVYLVARPVVYKATKALVRNFTDDKDVNGDYAWTDERPIHAGADYVMDNGEVVSRNSYGPNYSASFDGNSVTIASSDIEMRNRSFTGNVIMWPGALFNVTKVFEAPVRGAFRLVSDGSDSPWSNPSYAWVYGSTASPVFEATISGDGYLSVYSKAADKRGVASILSTNENWTGGIYLDHGGNLAAGGVTLSIGNALSLGGDLPGPSINWHATTVAGEYARIKPLASMTLNRANAAVDVVGGGFNVPDDVVLTFLQPVCIRDRLIKDGLGALFLGGDVRYGLWHSEETTDDVKIVVQEGTLGPAGAKSQLDKSYLQFADGAGIAVNPFATGDAQTWGLALKNAPICGSTLALSVPKELAQEFRAKVKAQEIPDVVTVGICTVPADSALEAKILTAANRQALQIRRFAAEVIKDEPESGYTRYAVRYTYQRGMSVIVR